MPMTKFERWLCAWAGLGASIVRIVTFAKVDPSFDIATLEHYIVKNIKKRKLAREALNLQFDKQQNKIHVDRRAE